jgi:hypothetical protein
LNQSALGLFEEVGLSVFRHWDGLYLDVDILEQEMQDTIEAVQQQFCREGRIWQGQRYQGNPTSGLITIQLFVAR